MSQHRFTGNPKFHIYFKDTSETYTNLDLDYVLKYSTELPLKYNTLKAQWIVRKARAGLQSLIPSSTESDAPVEEKTEESSNEQASDSQPLNSVAKPRAKRGGQRPVLLSKNKKQRDAAIYKYQNIFVISRAGWES